MNRGNNTIIVSSLSRAGSTALWRSIIKSVGYSNDKSDFCRRLPFYDYPKHTVYKTHDFPPSYNIPNHVRFIWTFVDPCEIVLSVINQEEKQDIEWIEGHFENMYGEFDRYRDIYMYDALHLEEHFNEWYQEHDFELLTIKYRSIWKREKEISQFIGSDVNLPTFSPRQSRFDKLSSDRKEMMLDTYGDLRAKIRQAEDFKIW